MTIDIRDPLAPGESLTNQLKGRSRRRRERLANLAEASTLSGSLRNDPLPQLELASVPLTELRLPARKLRKRDAAHVQEVARAIQGLGFCVPLLIARNNLVLDGAIRF